MDVIDLQAVVTLVGTALIGWAFLTATLSLLHVRNPGWIAAPMSWFFAWGLLQALPL